MEVNKPKKPRNCLHFSTKKSFLKSKCLKGYCTSGLGIEVDCDRHWFPRTCCDEHAKYDRRTPGLFKNEFQGDEIIGLSSKTYIVSSRRQKVQSSAMIAANRLLRRGKKSRSMQSQNSKQRLVTSLKFSCKGISKKRLKASHFISTCLKNSKSGNWNECGIQTS